MKYIRTENGIFEFAKRFDLEHYKKVGFSDEDIVKKFTRNGNKVADNIEELCDELVVHNPSNDGDFYPKHFVYKNKWETMLKPLSDYQKSKGIEIYGAIWTEKGLIYVARMNDKGEFILL